MERALLILSCIALFLSSLIELKKREAIKNRYSDTWEHVTPTKPGYITSVSTGESRALTEEEIDDFRKRK